MGQAAVRVDGEGQKLFFTNSILNRLGEPGNPNNGRFIDSRGNPIDSVWVENCVIYAVTSRIYRSANGALNVGIFNQNTFWGVGQEGITFGESNELTFTNNIFAEPVFLGQTDSSMTYAMTIDTFVSGEHLINVSYNNIFVSEEFEAALPDTRASGDSLYSVKNTLFGPNISAAIMEGASATTNISEVLEFADAPPVPIQFITADAAAADTSVLIDGAGDWDFSDLTPDPVYSAVGGQGIDRFTTFHDFSYPESAQSYTAGTNGQKLGADLTNLGTDVDEDFFVTDNILFYPNPVKDELFIQNLDEVDLKSVYIYDVQGHPLRRQDVNAMNIRFQMGKLPPGIYMLSVEDHAGKVSTRQILKY